MSSAPLPFASVARLPAPEDNVAIAIRRLEAGEILALPGGARPIAHTVLEGHRFAVQPIAAGAPLLSWGMPFGHALAPIAPGDYVCNQSMLDALAIRRVAGATLPAQPNFADRAGAFRFDEKNFRPAPPTPTIASSRTFQGYRRAGRRGVGTRNFIVLLGTTSQTASFVRQLAARLQPLARVHPGIDGIVPVAHTEGAGPGEPNNATEILRALAGFIVHPNVAAVLAVDRGSEPVANARLRDFMRAHDYPLDDVPHRFFSIGGGLAAALSEAEGIVRAWLPVAAATPRTAEPLSGLRIALQCGGSDAFSGVSGNPLAGAVVHEAVRHGGTGVLTETDEAVGGENYLLQNIRDLATARALLGKIEAFRERLSWHGTTPESNPSGGNKLRGLYNIALKSLGAVHKKDPRTRIDAVIDYAAPLAAPGFYFMNGPGNDLEGIAGQAAAGCNLIVFVTGNGSITNFPFVPTLKITTTTRRHQLLVHEMDINAGRYLDGEAMTTLAADTFDLLLATASGKKTKGEHAGHAQVSLWRNWRQTDGSRLAALKARTAPDGKPLALAPALRGASVAKPDASPAALAVFRTDDDRFATERVGLVLPTSLCAAQIARLAADRLNEKQLGAAQGISRFVALAHTEGCGFGGETLYRLLERTYRGYITHPNVAAALLLEHGCEKIPNDAMRRQVEAAEIPATRFGWASVQLDGGIARALDKIEAWFAERLAALAPCAATPADFGALNAGFMSDAAPDAATAAAFAAAAETILRAGGSVLLPENDPLLASAAFRAPLLGRTPVRATLAYGQPLTQPGLHVVATESTHWVENATGLGGCGAHVILGLVHAHAQQGHPLVPVVQVADAASRDRIAAADVDAFLTGSGAEDATQLLQLLGEICSRRRAPVASAQGFVDFQLTRGELGVST
ncbi:MAG TPA: UxaA family hydrolase [Opitutaceae bacterium]|nr:UxaA family hydrolase [Opitutaceae bacterium]